MNKSPTDVDVYAGSRMRAIRIAKGVSQEKLGESLGITFQQVQKYEKGVNRMSASRLHAVCEALGIPITDLFPDAGRDAFDAGAGLSPQALSVAKRWDSLPPKARGAVLAIVDALPAV